MAPTESQFMRSLHLRKGSIRRRVGGGDRRSLGTEAFVVPDDVTDAREHRSACQQDGDRH
jgi:hypothetical protein